LILAVTAYPTTTFRYDDSMKSKLQIITHTDNSLAVGVSIPGLLVNLERASGCQQTDERWHFTVVKRN